MITVKMNIMNAILICIISKQLSASEPEYNMFEAIKNYGYPVETHEVLTEDGYILTLYRIPHGQHSTDNETNKYPVLLHHGMASSSDCFVILGPEESLGFVLADNGYDVWMLNARGSWHSRKHQSLDPDTDRSFWQFSWHEIGVYDIPATIDYVLGVTRKRDLHYVGHSQGTTTIFVMASERPEYNSKLKVVIAMAPAAVFKDVKNPLFKIITQFTDLWKALADYLEIYELPPPNVISARQIRDLISDLCTRSYSLTIICQISMNVLQNGGNSLLDAIEMVKSRGYPIEIHEVETEDGYLLNVFRIPHGRKSDGDGKTNPYPVLMQHGLFGCGEHFIWMNKSMGYLLADHGYDVWVMNVRGSSYSIKHRTLNPEKDSSYWRFTWHEIGIYDIPATIDYILNNTGAKNVSFIGHSQGATTMFVMGAFRPEYNGKVNGMIAIGPITVLLNPTDTVTNLFAPNYKLLRAIGRFLNIQKFPPLISIGKIHAVNRFFCRKESYTFSICKRFLIASSDDQFETEMLPIVAPLTPSTCSYHQLIHYGQNFVDKKFTTFDWESAEENLRRYGSEKPVEYNTTNISFKVALYLSPNDVFVSDQGEQLLISTLPNISEVYKVPYDTWTHIDFIWGKDMDIYEHPNLLETLNGFTHN